MLASTPAGASLVDLHRSGQLAACYPRVAGLLADLPETELPAAGQLLSRLDTEQVRQAHPAIPAVRVAVTGHATFAQLIPPLTAQLARHGLIASTLPTDFDSYLFQLGDPASGLYAFDPALTICLLDPMVVFDEVPVVWGPEDVARVADEKHRSLSKLASIFHSTCPGTLVFNTVPLLRRHTGQLVDHRSRARLGALWRDFNARLLRLAEDHPAVVTIDLDPVLAEGVAAFEPRLSAYAKAHLSPELLAAYAREVGHLARHVAGRTKKVLAVDLDGTLWDGTVGDDGPDGIRVGGEEYRGRAFASFQRVLKQLTGQGVLLAAVSKNDPEPVQAVLRDHPGMVLREDDFIRVVANWRPKHDNLAELATALNVDVDSLAFVDDSAAERGLVRQALPGVGVVPLDDEPARHADALLRDGWFDSRELTGEDRARVSRYRDEVARRGFLDTFESVEEYLRELRVRVRLTLVDESELARVSQLTLRTNQFNVTTRRMQPADVRALAADPTTRVLTIHATDRFGDNGLVGVIVVRRADGALYLDDFLLSCRVFSRGIERACLSAVLRHGAACGATAVFGGYRPTAKNHKVADFYPRNGFHRCAIDGDTTLYRHDLAVIPDPPEHINLFVDMGDGRP